MPKSMPTATTKTGIFLNGKTSTAIIKKMVIESEPTQKYAVVEAGMATKIKKEMRAR